MFTSRLYRLAAVLAVCCTTAAAAQQDRMLDEKPCGVFCQLLRNLSRNAQVSFAAPIDNGTVSAEPTPEADEGADRPNLSAIAVVRDSVMAETPAERRAIERQKAAMEQSLTAASTGAQHYLKGTIPHSVQADEVPPMSTRRDSKRRNL